MRTHICLVSAQAAANLLPALDPALKPDRVFLVVSGKMQKQAGHLKMVLQENAIRVEHLQLADEHDFRRIEQQLLELAGGLDGEDVFLNVTGGTKLMSVAAQSVAQASDWRMFYVDADTDRVTWLGADGDEASRPLQQQLKLRHYLQSYGFSLAGKPNQSHATPEQQDLLRTLLIQIGSLQGALGTLNHLASCAEERRGLAVTLNEQQGDSRSLEALLRNFEAAGTLKVQGGTVQFASPAARDFAKGGWLELHAMQTVQAVSGELAIRDKAIGLEVIDDATGTRNELDIAFMARNRLWVIECKTGRIDKPDGGNGQPKANDAMFKLAENCRRIGGLGTRGMLLSYRKLRDSELRLARALGIEVVSGTEVAHLRERLIRWVAPHA